MSGVPAGRAGSRTIALERAGCDALHRPPPPIGGNLSKMPVASVVFFRLASVPLCALR